MHASHALCGLFLVLRGLLPPQCVLLNPTRGVVVSFMSDVKESMFGAQALCGILPFLCWLLHPTLMMHRHYVVY